MLRSVNGQLALGALLCVCVAFYLFTYNSGYGYDALEYLVIGRSIAEGVPLYTYLPSKSPLLYYVIASLYRVGIDFDHLSLAAVITAIYFFTVLLTYIVAKRWFSGRAAIAIAALTALAAPFMEMNFLQPTALFYMCGLAAFDSILRFERNRRFAWLLVAGLALGIGIGIKSTAAFYGLAAAHFLVVLWAREGNSFAWLCRCGVTLATGAVVALGTLATYYWTLGRLGEFIEWTFTFPFANYPSSTTYIAKAYTKLLWVHLFILGCVPILFARKLRTEILSQPAAVLALLFGACSYVALLKTQASHYFFPGAPFLMMFAVAVYDKRLGSFAVSRKLIAKGSAAAAVLCVSIGASIAFYRPDAAARLTTFKNFAAEEKPVRDYIHSQVKPDEFVLVTGGTLSSTWSYWISHRYPPPPFINMDVKTIWMLRHRPDAVFRVLDHPNLKLVQFEPAQLDNPVLEDVFGEQPHDRSIMRDYFTHVSTRFKRIDQPAVPATFWRRDVVRAASATLPPLVAR